MNQPNVFIQQTAFVRGITDSFLCVEMVLSLPRPALSTHHLNALFVCRVLSTQPRTAVYVQRIPSLLFPSWQWQRKKGNGGNWPSSNKDLCHAYLSVYWITSLFHTLNLLNYRSIAESTVSSTTCYSHKHWLLVLLFTRWHQHAVKNVIVCKNIAATTSLKKKKGQLLEM